MGRVTQELAGDNATVYSATTARQDRHVIQARPSLISAARNADLVVCTGAELETGWLPILLRQSGNAKIQPGTPGYFEAADFVQKLEVPARLDRSAGDVHRAEIRISRPILATSRGWPRARQQAGRDRSRQRRCVSGPIRGLSKRWAAAPELAEESGPLRGTGRGPAQAFPYLEQWLGQYRSPH
jgi:zinc/manganese transport system substrate-binding protein